MKILITGGAGFVGSSLARLFKEEHPGCKVTAFDNLRRRGSERNLAIFRKIGVDYVHGDIRSRSDLEDIPGDFDLIVEASAEPSVHAGTGGQSPVYLMDTNLAGTLNCLEYGRRCGAGMIFLSTSRVYAIPALRAIRLREASTRFEPEDADQPAGLTHAGVSESFPTVGSGFRSLYGSSKLASELFVEEYAYNYNYPAVIDRCGVIAGAGQFGKTDQGVFTLWVARHIFGGPLSYTGFGGQGKQVRDILHPRDLFELLKLQISRIHELRGDVFCIGGGVEGSVSLREYTTLCQNIVNRELEIGSFPPTSEVDIPYYVTDYSKARNEFGWEPRLRPAYIVQDIFSWIDAQRADLQPLFS